MVKTKLWIFSKVKYIILSNQSINSYSNEVKNRHVQFGDPTSLGKGSNGKCTLWLTFRKCMEKSFTDND